MKMLIDRYIRERAAEIQLRLQLGHVAELAVLRAEAVQVSHDFMAAELARSQALSETDIYGAINILAMAVNGVQAIRQALGAASDLAPVTALLADLLDRTGQPLAAGLARQQAANDDGFYRMTWDCQVALLPGLYDHFLGKRATGCFVEVGAYDGETHSNTSCLADLGWRGLYIEPIKSAYETCVERHRRNAEVSVVNCAIGDREGALDFYVLGSASSSSLERVQSAEWAPEELRRSIAREVQVPQQTLDKLLEQQAIPPGFDLLVIDVEGSEDSVLRGTNLELWRPRLVIAELSAVTMAEMDGATMRDALRPLAGAGYRPVLTDNINTVFARP
jgi:FkbM family methyltransferase